MEESYRFIERMKKIALIASLMTTTACSTAERLGLEIKGGNSSENRRSPSGNPQNIAHDDELSLNHDENSTNKTSNKFSDIYDHYKKRNASQLDNKDIDNYIEKYNLIEKRYPKENSDIISSTAHEEPEIPSSKKKIKWKGEKNAPLKQTLPVELHEEKQPIHESHNHKKIHDSASLRNHQETLSLKTNISSKEEYNENINYNYSSPKDLFKHKNTPEKSSGIEMAKIPSNLEPKLTEEQIKENILLEKHFENELDKQLRVLEKNKKHKKGKISSKGKSKSSKAVSKNKTKKFSKKGKVQSKNLKNNKKTNKRISASKAKNTTIAKANTNVNNPAVAKPKQANTNLNNPAVAKPKQANTNLNSPAVAKPKQTNTNKKTIQFKDNIAEQNALKKDIATETKKTEQQTVAPETTNNVYPAPRNILLPQQLIPNNTPLAKAPSPALDKSFESKIQDILSEDPNKHILDKPLIKDPEPPAIPAAPNFNITDEQTNSMTTPPPPPPVSSIKEQPSRVAQIINYVTTIKSLVLNKINFIIRMIF